MSQVTPELAGKVLDADIRNIIGKVQSNKPLTAGERELFQQFAVEREQLQQARQAALVRKWLKGGRLSPAEVEEISGIVPTTKETAVSEPQAYQRTQAEYAKIYSCEGETTDVRTIKRWVKSGREANPPYLPPLDSPLEMPGWWSAVMQRRVPRRISEAAAKAQMPSTPQPVVTSTPAEEPAPSFVPILSSEEVGKVGIASALERMQVEERDAYARYVASKIPGPDGVINQGAVKVALQMWTDIAEKLRKLEFSAAEAGDRTGELLSKSDVRAAIVDIHTNIAEGIRKLFRRVRPRLPGIDMTRAKEQDAIFDEEVDSLFREFQNSAFAARLDFE